MASAFKFSPNAKPFCPSNTYINSSVITTSTSEFLKLTYIIKESDNMTKRLLIKTITINNIIPSIMLSVEKNVLVIMKNTLADITIEKSFDEIVTQAEMHSIQQFSGILLDNNITQRELTMANSINANMYSLLILYRQRGLISKVEYEILNKSYLNLAIAIQDARLAFDNCNKLLTSIIK